MTRTAIGFTEQVWNVIVGCSLKSPACTHCYAMAPAARKERLRPRGEEELR
jgi:protein gp37